MPKRATLRRICRLIGWWGAWCACTAAGAEASAPARHFDLRGGAAADVLRDFARAAGVQLLIPERAVRGVQLPPLRGDYTADEALQHLVAGSELVVVRDAASGAYSVKRDAHAAVQPAAGPSRRPASVPSDAPPPPVAMEPVRVEPNPEFGVTTPSILRADPGAPVYYHVTTRAEIEESGAANMAELITTLPGYSGEGAEALQTTADLTFRNGANVYEGSFLKLRGWDAQHTAVLLNGRPVPVSPETRGPDLSRIPLAAVERIEVMPFAGSALYGDGAAGGAMNIVLRKDFTGEAVTLQTGTAAGGGNEAALTWLQGYTAANGRTRVMIVGDAEHRSALRLHDRDFLSRALARVPPDRLLPIAQGPDWHQVLNAELIGYPGVFAVTDATIDLGLAGQPGARFAVVPVGVNAAQLAPGQSLNVNPLTIASRREDRVVIRRPVDEFNLNLQLEHSFSPAFTVYGEFSYARAEERFRAPDAIEPLTLTSKDPRNPFHDDPTRGIFDRSVRFYFDPVDLPDARYEQRRDSGRLVGGARGGIGARWSWVVDSFTDVSRSHGHVHAYGASLNDLIRTWTATRGDTLASFYDPLADHRATPISADARERFLAQDSELDYRSRMAGADVRVGGTLLELPAGPVHVSFGGEYLWRDVTSSQVTQASREFYGVLDAMNATGPGTGTTAANPFAVVTAPQSSASHSGRTDGVAEAMVPLLRDPERRFLLRSVELNLATRVTEPDGEHAVWSNLAALKVAPSSWWALRGTLSQGHVAPDPALVNGPLTETPATVGVRDPQRGNTQQVYAMKIIQGGRPTLHAESSEAQVGGLVVQPAPGWFVSIDAWSITMRDRLRVPTVQEVLDHAGLFPDRIERGLPAPSEALIGWAGRVSRVDLRPINVTQVRASGIDITGHGSWSAGRLGDLTLHGQLEMVRRYEEQLLPGAAAVDKINVVTGGSNGSLMEAAVVSPRGRASLGWRRNNWSALLALSYTPRYQTDSTTPTATLPNANGLDGDYISSSVRWDLQAGYRFKPRVASGPRSWLAGSTWTIGIRNVFNAEPPYRSDGTSFYSRFEDPRMRFFYLRAEWRR